MTDELTFELGRIKKPFVTSRTATRALDVTLTDPQAVGDRLGVRYVLSDSVRQLGARICMTLSLAERTPALRFGVTGETKRLKAWLRSLMPWCRELHLRFFAALRKETRLRRAASSQNR